MSTILNFPNSFAVDFENLSIRNHLQTLIDFVDRQPHGLLHVDAPWRPSRLAMKELARQTQDSDTFWTNLTILAAAALHLEILPDGFLVGTEPIPDTEEDTRLSLLRGFTSYLAPPTIAASLFVTLRLHPMAGLAVVGHIDSPFFKNPPQHPHLEAARGYIFEALTSIMFELTQFHPSRTYSREDVMETVLRALPSDKDVPEAIIVAPDIPNTIIRTFVTEFLDDYLQTAGAVLRIDDKYTFNIELLKQLLG